MVAQFLERVPSKFYLGVLAVVAGLLLGLSIVFTSPFIVITALLLIIMVPLIIRAPIIAVLGIIVLNSTILYGNANIGISIGIGHIYLTDILLLTTLLLIGLRALVEPKFNIIHTPLDMPMLLFVGIAFLSTFLAVRGSSITLQQSLGEVRVVASYLVFFLVTNLVRGEKELRFLINSFLFLATLVALITILQFLTGAELPFLPGRVETLTTQDTTYVGITRVLPPGQSLIIVASIAIIVLLAIAGRSQINLWSYIQGGAIGLAVIISFNRSFWAMIVIALLILAYLIRNRELPNFISLGLITIVVAVVLLFPLLFSSNSFIGEFVNATFTRLATLINPSTLGENSLQFRAVEDQYVLPQVLAHPFLGLGLGANYRPHDPNIADLLGYIHNAHFWLMMKTGLLGYAAFVWLSIVFLVRSFKYWRLIPDLRMRAYVLSFALTYVGVLVGAIVNPMFMQAFWTPVLGIMFGFNEAIIGLTLAKTTNGNESRQLLQSSYKPDQSTSIGK